MSDQIDAALDEHAPGPAAEEWRLLRADIRALVPPLDPAFEARLHERLAASRVTDRKAKARSRRSRSIAAIRPRLLAAGGAAALVVIALAVFVLGSPTPSRPLAAAKPGLSARENGPPVVSSGTASHVHSDQQAVPLAAAPAEASTSAPGSASLPAAARLQQLGASITLATVPDALQRVADEVSRLAGGEGGYVQSSQVEVARTGTSEATLQLNVPSARLTRTLTALARLAAVRAQSQSLQDITSTYDSAHRALTDAAAERAALLKALAHATTQGEVESLHARLAIAASAIERARSHLDSVSASAANSTIAVTVLGTRSPAAGEGLTLHRGLHDAGRVLTIALISALIGLAALLPLLLLGALLLILSVLLRRVMRERALGPR